MLLKQPQEIDLDDLMKQRIKAQEQAKAALILAAKRMKWYYDKGVQEIPFKVGDKVMLSLKDYQNTEKGLRPQYDGPFEIVEKLSEVDFKLKLPIRYRAIHPVFHASKLAAYQEPIIPGQKQVPSQPIIASKDKK